MERYNPFINARPVASFEEFFGREHIINYIYHNVINIKKGENVALISENGYGKSSVLNSLFFEEIKKDKLKNDKVIMVKIDFPKVIENMVHFYKILHYQLMDSIIFSIGIPEEILSKQSELLNKNESETDLLKTQKNLEMALRLLSGKGYKVLFIIDNFERLIKETDIKRKQFDFLRSLHSSMYFNVSYIIAVDTKLDVLSEDAKLSGFDNIFTTYPLIPFYPALGKEDVRAYIEENFGRWDLQLSENEEELIYSLSGGIPNILRLCCKVVFDLKDKGEMADYEAVLEKLQLEGRAYFSSLYDRSTKEERNFYRYMLEGTVSEGDQGLNEALSRGIVIRDENLNNYSFVSQAYREYVNSTLALQAEEEEIACEETCSTLEVSSQAEDEDKFKALEYKFNDLQKIVMGLPNMFLQKLVDMNFYGQLTNTMNELKTTYGDDINDEVFMVKMQSIVDTYINPKDIDNIFNKNEVEFNSWDSLSERAKTYIMRGECLYKLFPKNFEDFAAVALFYCKALEEELNATLLPLMKLCIPDYVITNRNNKISMRNMRSMMIGEFMDTLRKQYEGNLLATFQKKKINLDSFIDKLNQARILRNDTAHTGKIISYDQLISLRSIVLNSKDSLLSDLSKLF